MKAAILGPEPWGRLWERTSHVRGVPIDLIDPYEAHVEALNKNGARVTGCDDFVVPVHALTLDQMEGYMIWFSC